MTHIKSSWERATELAHLDRRAIERLVRPVAGRRRVTDATLLHGGRANTNYRVVLDDDSRVVVRLYGRARAALGKELALSERMRDRAPVPRFLHADASGDLTEKPYAVLEWLPGHNAADLVGAIGPAERATLIRAMAEILARFQDIRFPTPGLLDDELEVCEPFDGGGEGFRAMIHADLFEREAARHLSAAELDDLMHCVRNGADELDAATDTPPNLVHGDYGPENVLVSDDLTVTGVLDWEFAFSGSSLVDAGHLLRPPWHDDPAADATFEEAFRAAGGHLPAGWRRLSRLADLVSWTEFLARPAAGPRMLATCRRVIADTVAALRSGGRAT